MNTRTTLVALLTVGALALYGCETGNTVEEGETTEEVAPDTGSDDARSERAADEPRKPGEGRETAHDEEEGFVAESKEAAGEIGEAAKTGAEEVGETTEEGLEKVGEGTEDLGEAIQEGVSDEDEEELPEEQRNP